MGEMVERVSAAIERVIEERPLVEASPAVIRKLVADKVARAAIEAMREPTEAMIEAGATKDEDLEWDHSWRAVPQVYETMIDAALA